MLGGDLAPNPKPFETNRDLFEAVAGAVPDGTAPFLGRRAILQPPTGQRWRQEGAQVAAVSNDLFSRCKDPHWRNRMRQL